MKTYCLFITMFAITWSNLFGEIKNGYGTEIFKMRDSLETLTSILDISNNLPASQKRKIETKIKLLLIDISYYELTEKLLDQFKIISPVLYNEIDTIKDRKGRAVDVYVKFIPTRATPVKAWGTTYMAQSARDEDTYCSEYGGLTVSIKIWTVNKALLVLSHELGHVKYQVPHLASYMEYYKEHYYTTMDHSNNMGHDASDRSGDSARKYEKIFRKEFAFFLRMKNGKIQNPLVLMKEIRKNLGNDNYTYGSILLTGSLRN